LTLLPKKYQETTCITIKKGNVIVRVLLISTFLLSIGIFNPALGGYNYEFEYDRFSDSKKATFQANIGSECKLLVSKKGELRYCSFSYENPNEGGVYPVIAVGTSSDDWDITDNGKPTFLDDINTIITYNDNTTSRLKLKASTLGQEITQYSIFAEVVMVHLGQILDELTNIRQIEFKYGSNEYLFIIDQKLLKKTLNFEK